MKEIINFFDSFKFSLDNIDHLKIQKIARLINDVRKKRGRIFFLGVGASAGNATHAVNDFRKLCNIECYAPTDNVSELTARINDEGWDTSFKNWLITSKLSSKDAIFIFSVGGGNIKKKVSVNLIEAIKLCKKRRGKVLGIVGKKNGYTYKKGDAVLNIEINQSKLTTPISEAMQAVVWHCLVSQPILQKNKTKW